MFSSPGTFKQSVQTMDGEGKVRHNVDLLPSPLGLYPTRLCKLVRLIHCSGPKMGMAALLCVLLDYDIQSK